MERFRKSLSIFFLVLYILLTPLIILYSLGYIIEPSSPASKQQIVKTGGIFLLSTPTGAKVSLNGTAYQGKTPLSILNLNPGSYTIDIDMPGFLQWSRKVVVKAGEVVSPDDILLVPKQWKAKEILPQAFSNLIPAPGAPFLIFQQGRRLDGLYIFNEQNGALIPVVDPESQLGGARVDARLMAPASKALVLEVSIRGHRMTLLARVRLPNVTIEDVTSLFGEDPIERVEWSGDDPEDFFPLHSGSVDWVHLPSSTVLRGFLHGVRGLGLSGNDLYVLNGVKGLFRLDYATGSQEALPAVWEGVEPLFQNSFVRILSPSPGLLIFRDDKGSFAATLRDLAYNGLNIRGFSIDPVAGKILLWQRGRLGVLDYGSNPPAFIPEWAPVRGADIQQAFFAFGDTHALYRDGNSVFLTGLREGGRTFRIVTVLRGTSISYSNRRGILYYIDAAAGRPSFIVVVPREPALEELLQSLPGRG